MNAPASRQDVTDALSMAHAVCEAVRESGPAGIPLGHIYAAVMGRLDQSGFQSLMGMLSRTGLVRIDGQVAKWVGPEIGGAA